MLLSSYHQVNYIKNKRLLNKNNLLKSYFFDTIGVVYENQIHTNVDLINECLRYKMLIEKEIFGGLNERDD